MVWSTDTKTGYNDLEVYMEYGYVFVSSTGRNHAKMAAFSFNFTHVPYIRLTSILKNIRTKASSVLLLDNSMTISTKHW